MVELQHANSFEMVTLETVDDATPEVSGRQDAQPTTTLLADLLVNNLTGNSKESTGVRCWRMSGPKLLFPMNPELQTEP